MKRRGDWIQTYTGRKFWPLDPRPEEIFIEDIAHALALQCRFAGHCREHYSVAEHSWRVSLNVPLCDAMWALLHDASEAYLGDFVQPLKHSWWFGWFYRRAERRLIRAICERFSLPYREPVSVKWADRVMILWEQRDLMAVAPDSWGIQDSRLRIPERKLWPLGANLTEKVFLGRFHHLRYHLQGQAARAGGKAAKEN